MSAVYGAGDAGRGKDTLKTLPIIIETCGAPGFLDIKALDEIISEPEPRPNGRRVCWPTNRREERACSPAIFFASLSRFNYVEFL